MDMRESPTRNSTFASGAATFSLGTVVLDLLGWCGRCLLGRRRVPADQALLQQRPCAGPLLQQGLIRRYAPPPQQAASAPPQQVENHRAQRKGGRAAGKGGVTGRAFAHVHGGSSG